MVIKMKIIKDIVQADFKDLVIGTVFEYNSQFFMKTENLLHGIEDGVFNSFNLEDGYVTIFDESDKVHVLDAELRVNYRRR